MADALFDYVKLLLPFNGDVGSTTFTDYSILRKAVSRLGDSIHSDAESVLYDTSLYLDGTGDCLTVSNSGFDFHSSDYTVDFWVNYSVLPVGKTILSSAYATTSSRVPLYIRHASTLTGTSGSNLVVGYYNGTHYGVVTAFVPEIARWYHIAVTRSGSNLLVFVDGVQVGTFAIASAVVAATSTEFRIGRRWETASAEYFAGYLQDLRVTSGATRYTEPFTPPTEGLYETAPSFAGAVCDVGGSPASRTIRVYLRSTGALVATLTSDPVTGTFDLVGLSNAAHDIQILSSGVADGCDIFLPNQLPQ
jgi:hypothetical protein